MSELDDLLGQLRQFWTGQGLACGQPAAPEAIITFEQRHGVRLPEDLGQYFRQVNGMGSLSDASAVDDNDIRFYPLDEVTPDETVAGEHGRLFTFADFLISSYDYAVELAPASQQSGAIYAVAGARVQVAKHFTDFLHRYLVSDRAILYPWGHGESCGAV